MGIGGLIVLWMGSREVVGGRMTVGELVAFNTYLNDAVVADDRVRLVTNLIQRGMAREADARGVSMRSQVSRMPGTRGPSRLPAQSNSVT